MFHVLKVTLSPAKSAGPPGVTRDMKIPSSSPLNGVEPTPPAMLKPNPEPVLDTRISCTFSLPPGITYI